MCKNGCESLWSLVLACCLNLLPSSGTQAALISADLLAPGDGLITRDTATNLDWLDLTPTIGLSFNQVAGGAGGWTSLGFRYATTTEVMGLYTDAGIVIFGGTTSPLNVPGVSLLLGLMGITSTVGPTPSETAIGLAESVPPDPTFAGTGFITLFPALPPSTPVDIASAAVTSAPFPGLPSKSEGSNQRGSYLVRTAVIGTVPEPAISSLILLGIAVAGLVSRRRNLH